MASDRRKRVSSAHVPEPPPGTFSRASQVGNHLFVARMTANSPAGVEGGDYLRARQPFFTADPPASTLQ